MYEQFALFPASYFPSPFGRLSLRVVDRTRTLIALALDGPFAFVGDDMLILTRHRFSLHARIPSRVQTHRVRDALQTNARSQQPGIFCQRENADEG